MKLHTNKVAPNPRKVAIFLAEKAIEVETVEVDLAGKENYSAAFMAKNALARVPVLELDDGLFLAESAAICRYFEELQPIPPLLGVDSVDRAFVEMWTRRMESELMGNMTACFRHLHPYWAERITQVPAYGELCRSNIDESMQWLDGVLADQQFIAGERFTLADITAVCAFDLGKVAKIRIPDALANLTRWYNDVNERESVSSTRPGR